MRDPALHDWPELTTIAATSRATESASASSSRMMLADLPPSSCATRLTVGAAFLATSMPARVDPVNETMSTSGCEDNATPTVGPSPLTRLNTPGGTPASSRISANTSPLSGAISDGLSTTVQPAARAGATLAPIWFSGQFQGVISAQTPTGSRTTVVELTFSSNSKFFSASRPNMRCPRPAGACAPCARLTGAPISMLTASARSPRRREYTSMIFSNNEIRSSRVVSENVSNALRAAATACSTSFSSPRAIVATTSSVAGLMTSRVEVDTGSTHCPSM